MHKTVHIVLVIAILTLLFLLTMVIRDQPSAIRSVFSRAGSTEVSGTETSIQKNHQEQFYFNRNYSAYNTLLYADKVSLKKSKAIITIIKANCRKMGFSTKWNLLRDFSKPRLLIAKSENHILYGSNPKTGSTSFKKFLFHLDGDFHNFNFSGNPRGHYEIVEEATFFSSVNQMNFEDYVKIFSVRNPITRLLSAFRNKQLRKNQIFIPTEGMSDRDQFVKLIIILVSGGLQFNVHFMPQWKQMDFCRFPYDVVIQFEEAQRYTSLVQSLTNTTHTEYPGSRTEIGLDDHDTLYYVGELWGALSSGLKKQVYAIYEMDFKLLGYTKVWEPLFPMFYYQDLLPENV